MRAEGESSEDVGNLLADCGHARLLAGGLDVERAEAGGSHGSWEEATRDVLANPAAFLDGALDGEQEKGLAVFGAALALCVPGFDHRLWERLHLLLHLLLHLRHLPLFPCLSLSLILHENGRFHSPDFKKFCHGRHVIFVNLNYELPDIEELPGDAWYVLLEQNLKVHWCVLCCFF